MGKYNLGQIGTIILRNPNKQLVQKGRTMADKLMRHVHGVGAADALKRAEYFESAELYNTKKDCAISNIDLFARLLQKEDMVFTARGGSSFFGLSEENEKTMHALLDDIRYNMSLRKWIQTFALQAYRSDPMGIILMEIESVTTVDDQPVTTPKAYPTYKSTYSIHDYLPIGRRLEYVCFKLTVAQAISFGVQDPAFKDMKPDAETKYFRFIDDEKDIIVVIAGTTDPQTGESSADTVMVATNVRVNPIANEWGRVPAFVVSDLMRFDDPACLVSPLYYVVELADTYLEDRSVRNLQKKYHGFAKAIEPMLDCPTCFGDGYVGGKACPDCTPSGGDKGTGFKLKTKVADVAKFPLDILKEGNFDYKRIFGYVTPDIASWNKQDMSLEALEELMKVTYWGASAQQKTTGPSNNGTSGQGTNQMQETATKTLENMAPKEARLNATADWAEKTENLIATFIGQYWFGSTFKKSSIAYGRFYILKSPDELLTIYQSLRASGAPDFVLDEALTKYFHALYQTSPTELAIALKMLDVEPFPHLTIAQAKTLVTDFTDYNCKLYFGEWYSTLKDAEILIKAATELRQQLRDYVQAKGLKEPQPVNPILN